MRLINPTQEQAEARQQWGRGQGRHNKMQEKERWKVKNKHKEMTIVKQGSKYYTEMERKEQKYNKHYS